VSYYFFVFSAGLIFSTGVLLISPWFIALIQHTTALVNVLLEEFTDEQEQYNATSSKLIPVAKSLVILILTAFLLVIVSVLPFLLYTQVYGISSTNLIISGYPFWMALITGTIIPFIVISFKKDKKTYSTWSALLHRIILENQQISGFLFRLEKRFFKRKLSSPNKKFLIISGLARAGTTALTTLLFQTKNFHSLSYANVPFLLAPNIWSLLYNPKKEKLRERSHGDRVMFGYNTVEALEEYFWKVFLKNNYILPHSLTLHNLTKEVYAEYLNYQSLIRKVDTPNTLYIAKNNNFILRYTSMRELNKDFVFVLLFREPLDHAYSLLQQHQRYCGFQQDDSFILEYMTWLGHHEFGMGHKPFDFDTNLPDAHFTDATHINYWLASWINYYEYVLSLEEDPKRVLISYHRFLKEPEQVILTIAIKLGITLNTIKIEKFDNEKKIECEADENLLVRAKNIYARLLKIELV
jgi:hypothetical protein